MSLTKNQIIPLTVTGTTGQGSGVGRYAEPGETGGMVVFVPHTAPGDTIDCRILKVDKRCAYGKIETLLTPSADRCGETDCPAFGKCGGCVWRHVTYEAELRYKQQQVEDALSRIGGTAVPVRPIVGAKQPERYRNKAQFPVENGTHRPLFGFYAPHSHRVIEQRDCRLQPAHFRDVLDVIGRWMKKSGVTAYDPTAKTGLVRHVVIRYAAGTDETMACLVCTSGKLPETAALTAALREAVPSLRSLMVNLNREDTNVVLGETAYPLWGDPYITDTLCGKRFRLSLHSFYQVNREQAEVLYTLAAEKAALTGNETLLDLYCGTGTIGLTMADKVRTLIGVEIVPQAVEDARRNAAENGIKNARFLCADAGKAAVQLEQEGVRPDVIVLDPPRKGCSPDVIDAIGRMAPGRLVYVSCDPATLARDIARLREAGYTPQEATPVDLFPRTAHVETVVLMSRA